MSVLTSTSRVVSREITQLELLAASSGYFAPTLSSHERPLCKLARNLIFVHVLMLHCMNSATSTEYQAFKRVGVAAKTDIILLSIVIIPSQLQIFHALFLLRTVLQMYISILKQCLSATPTITASDLVSRVLLI